MNIIENPPQRIHQPKPLPLIKQINLPQSIVRQFNINENFIGPNKNNKNSFPEIQVDLLKSFNPEVNNSFKDYHQANRSYRSNQLIQIKPNKQLTNKISFSYGNKIHNTYQLKRNFSIDGVKLPNSVNILKSQNTNKYSNLSQLGKRQQNYNNNTIYSSLSQFQKQNQQSKIHKLGKKCKALYQDNNFENLKKDNASIQSNNDSMEAIQSSKKHFSNISIQKSQYIYIQNNGRINLDPEQYIYSHSKINDKPYYLKTFQSVNINNKPQFQRIFQNINDKAQVQKVYSNKSIYLPIQEERYSQMLIQSKRQLENGAKQQKSQKKINNKVYIDGQNQLMISQLKKIQNGQSRLSKNQDFNKLSKISKISQKDNHEDQDISILSKQNLKIKTYKQEKKEQIQLKQQINKQQQYQKQQQQQFLSKIYELEHQLQQKQVQNKNLLNKLQNIKLEQDSQKQLEKLEIMSKLSQIQIKKLKNELKMSKIKQKLAQNKQKQQFSAITSLKNEIKSLKSSLSSQKISSIFKKRDLNFNL